MVIFATSKIRALQILSEEVSNLYGGEVRVRVCGICIHQHKILLVNHSLYGRDGFFFMPPGGGVGFGETAKAALKREFREETGLNVEVGQLLFVNEHIQPPLHAIELFFRIDSFKGSLIKGIDPEMSREGQIIEEVIFMDWEQIRAFRDDQLHRVFSRINSLKDISGLGPFLTKNAEDPHI